MSGGAYDYAFHRIDDLADAIERRSSHPKRRAFAKLLKRCAEAARAIEWVDSGDTAPGDEMDAVDAALAFDAPAEMVAELRRQVIELETRSAQVRDLLGPS